MAAAGGRPGIRQRIIGAAVLGTAVAITLVTIDVARTILSGEGTGVRSWLFLFGPVLPVALVGAQLLGPFLQRARRNTPVRVQAGSMVSFLLTATVTAAFLVFAVERFRAPGLTAALVTLVAGVTWVVTLPVAAAVVTTLGRWRSARGVATGVLGIGIVCLLVVVESKGSEQAAHWTWLLMLAIVVVAISVRWTRWTAERGATHPAAVGAMLGVAALLCIAGLRLDGRAERKVMDDRSLLLPLLDRAARVAFDRDRDGFLSKGVLGGDDCDDGRSAVSPSGIEIPNNGVDEDCRFGDLAPPVRQHAAAPVAVDRMVIVTVSGLTVESGRWSPSLPLVEAKPGLHFTRSVGLSGIPAAVVLTGRLPRGAEPDGTPTGGPSLPSVVEANGGAAFLAASDSTQGSVLFHYKRSVFEKDPVARASALASFLKSAPPRSFGWLRLDVTPSSRDRVDQAISTLLDMLQPLGNFRLILVAVPAPSAMPADLRQLSPPPGGPVALFGHDLSAASDDVTAGMLDVYPTALAALGMTDPSSAWPQLTLPAGVSLEYEAQRIGVTGWMTTPPVLAAIDDRGAVVHDDLGRRFVVIPADGAARYVAEDARLSDWSAALLRRLRDEVVGPRLRAHLMARAHMGKELPLDMELLHDARIGEALQVLGYTLRPLSDDQRELTMYLRGGELLQAGDRLVLRMNWDASTIVPGDGARPFGTWNRGEIVECRLLLDLRAVDIARAILSIGVKRQGALLPVTHGHSGWLRVANLR